jgi:AcrR family transcriptional regulator
LPDGRPLAVRPGPAHVRGAHTRAGNAMNRTRQGLLDGAARAFADAGLRGSTMLSIARAAGVAKATLYNHFRAKDEVARALLSAEIRRVVGTGRHRPLAEALLVVGSEVAGHPVLRRLAVDEPAVLVRLLGAPDEEWSAVVDELGTALDLESDDAEFVARWLVGLALQPGSTIARRREAQRLALLFGRPGG